MLVHVGPVDPPPTGFNQWLNQPIDSASQLRHGETCRPGAPADAQLQAVLSSLDESDGDQCFDPKADAKGHRKNIKK
jgi:hypothetical protein